MPNLSVAVGARFELARPLRVYSLSKRAVSSTHPSHHIAGNNWNSCNTAALRRCEGSNPAHNPSFPGSL
jgi:hypothetical protein